MQDSLSISPGMAALQTLTITTYNQLEAMKEKRTGLFTTRGEIAYE
jgi:hypothetical protein